MPMAQSLQCETLAGHASRIAHGFFTRNGGTSSALYASLNVGLGSDDDADRVAKNREMVCQAIGAKPGQLATVSQVHSADVAIADRPWRENRPRADGIVSKSKGLVIGILTADCGPVLFADADAGVIGAAHAGWKGALFGVLENTISAMIDLGAERGNIVATLGPCISQKNYEVGPEYRAKFISADPANEKYFYPSQKPDHHMFDLATFVFDRLQNAGVKAGLLGNCTYQDETQFYSYRRSVHKNEPDYGRQISAIMLR